MYRKIILALIIVFGGLYLLAPNAVELAGVVALLLPVAFIESMIRYQREDW